MIQRHTCLAALDEGRSALGDQFDCPKCRTVLLEAFRSPPEAPDPVEEARQRHPSGRLPHLSVPADSARTVDLGRYSEPEGRVTEPFADVDAAHITEHGVDPDPDQPGGDWFVRCSCGWVETGHYARDGMGQRTAERLAKIKAQKHRLSPETEENDQ